MTVPSLNPSNSNNQEPAKVDFATYETSVAILERTRWKIQLPIQWKWGNEDGAIKFITEPSQRDKRKLLSSNRFRTILVRYPQENLLFEQKSFIDTAKNSGWINQRFEVFIKNNTAGSAILEAPDSISFIVQTPKDDKFPFFALSLTQRSTESHQRDADWQCLIFVRPKSYWNCNVERALFRDPFPHDYPDPLPPDMMMLPVALLRWQVDRILDEVNNVKRLLNSNRYPSQTTVEGSRTTVEGSQTTTEGSQTTVEDSQSPREAFFEMREKNLLLHRRWEFASELARTLIEAFGALGRRYSTEDDAGGYSPTLTANVVSQQATLKSLIHELDTTRAMIESQQNKFENDIIAAVQRRDSLSLKTIAIVTLVFLPATFMATIFSMGIFDWHAGQADDDHTIVSHWIWLYFVLSVVLTFIILVVWKFISKRGERKRNRK